MYRGLFQICLVENNLWLQLKQDVHLISLTIHMDGQPVGTFPPQREIYFDTSHLLGGLHLLTVSGTYQWYGNHRFSENFYFFKNEKWTPRMREFRPGDILVACDNVNGLPPGYMGHSAIVANENDLIEAVPDLPYIRKDTIQQFLEAHRIHAQFRPRDEMLGRKAANYAEWILKTYMGNVDNGKQIPTFSFTLDVPLHDPIGSIYCSKLVWLSYYYGGNYPFFNDFLQFAPEDLDSVLTYDLNFGVVYKHPHFHFKIDM